jgi:hypothetical protein
LLVQFTTEENSKSEGVIRVLTKVAYKDRKDTIAQALIASRDTLQPAKLAENAKEARARVKDLDVQLKRAQSETKANRERAKSELRKLAERIEESEAGVRSAKEDKAKQFWQAQLEKALLAKRKYEESIDQSERDVKARRDLAEVAAQRAEALAKLADAVCDKGRLEYRIYFQISGQDVELYRTKGPRVHRQTTTAVSAPGAGRKAAAAAAGRPAAGRAGAAALGRRRRGRPGRAGDHRQAGRRDRGRRVFGAGGGRRDAVGNQQRDWRAGGRRAAASARAAASTRSGSAC